MNDLDLNRQKAYKILDKISDPVLQAFLKSFLIQLNLAFININKEQFFKNRKPDNEFDYLFFLKAVELSFLHNRVFLESLLSNDKVPNDPFESL